MIFKVTFKDPDCRVQVESKPGVEYVDQLTDKQRELTDRFLEYSEYVTIVFDTARGTATVEAL